MKNYLLSLAFVLIAFTMKAQSNAASTDSNQTVLTVKTKIKVFPNPATNVVNILGLTNSNQANITISDVSGNVVIQRQWAIRNKALSIPVPNLKTGIYAVTIHSQEQQVQTKFYKN